MSNLFQRLITGSIFIAVLLSGLFVNSLVFILIFSIPLAGSIIEYLRLLPDNKTLSLSDYGVFAFGILLYYLFFLSQSIIMPKVLWASLSIPVIVLFIGIFRGKEFKKGIAFRKLAVLPYVVLPFVLMQLLVELGPDFNGKMLFYVFLFIWVNDSFAYVFGVKFGKHRILPSVSPKKSWEGFAGGLFMVGITAIIIALNIEQTYTIWHWLGFGFIVTLSGTIGDFFESYLKRKAGVKDSGIMLPGHGGFLDRFDSTLFAVPCSVVYLHLIHII